MVKRVYIWEWPVRLTHWLNFLSILALSATGFYIGAPFIHAVDENQSIMAQMLFIHFVSSYVFTVSFLLRVYWLFAGNKYSRWDQFIPIKEERRKNLYGVTLFYCFLRDKCPHAAGHTGLAGVAMLFLFIAFLIEILTGFALYSQSHVGAFWTLMGGWLFSIIDQGVVRLVHHLLTWAILIWALTHIYICWLHDLIERNGLVSSMFTGYKTLEE